jgi:hypothetical protein
MLSGTSGTTVWERINLLVAFALVGLPAVNLAVSIMLQRTSRSVTWFLVAATALAGFYYLQPRALTGKLTPSWPLVLAAAVQVALSVTLFSAYMALPDVDPYHWISVYQENFSDQELGLLPQRPLFHAAAYVLHTLLPLTAEQTFKYAIPLLSVAMLAPAWLLARRMNHPLEQLLILLYPSLSPSLIINVQMATPQAILIITTACAASFLIYAYLTRERRWHYVAGLVLCLSGLYHGLGLLLFTIWLSATAWHSPYRRLLPAILILSSIIALPYAVRHADDALSALRPNLTFPASFTTIDGEPNGWPGLAGTAKYYAFYAGPVVLGLLTLSIWRLLRMPVYRKQTRLLLDNPATLTLLLNLAVFLTLAEVLPRLANIVLLPERAWLMAALSSPVLLLAQKQNRLALSEVQRGVGFLLFGVTIFAAIHINSLKSHSIPDYMVISARWMGDNIAAGSVIAANRSPDLLSLYSRSSFEVLPEGFLCNVQALSSGELHAHLRAQLPGIDYLYLVQEDQAHPYLSRPWRDPLPATCIPNSLREDSEHFKALYRNESLAAIWQVL